MHAATMANISVGSWSDHVLHHIHVQLSVFTHVRWEDWAGDCLGISEQDLPDSEIQKLRDRSTTAAGSHCSRRNKEALSHSKNKFCLSFCQRALSFSLTHIYTFLIIIICALPPNTLPPQAQPHQHHKSPNSPCSTCFQSGKEGRRAQLNRCGDLSCLPMDHNIPSLYVPLYLTICSVHPSERMKYPPQSVLCNRRI